MTMQTESQVLWVGKEKISRLHITMVESVKVSLQNLCFALSVTQADERSCDHRQPLSLSNVARP